MNKKVLIIGSILALTGIGAFLYFKNRIPSFSIETFDYMTGSGKFRFNGTEYPFSVKDAETGIGIVTGKWSIRLSMVGNNSIKFDLYKNGAIASTLEILQLNK